jgi:hypothetical protein
MAYSSRSNIPVGHVRSRFRAAGIAAAWLWPLPETLPPGACATVEVQPSFISLDTFARDALPADAAGTPLPVSSRQPADAQQAALSTAGTPSEPNDAWTAHFARALQAQHARVREFLQAQRDRWQQIASHFTRQIESLQAEVHALQATNEGLRAELLARPAEGDQTELAADASRRYLMAVDDIRDLKARNAELQRQLLEAQSAPAQRGAAASAASDAGADWETQKRRLLAELASDDRQDAESADRRLKIEEVVARTDAIIAEKNREIEELRQLLANQSTQIGSLASDAAALGQVLDQDAIVCEERKRLQQLQDEWRDKLRQAEIELAMERARLARRNAEIEEKLRNAESGRSPAEPEALAPTGRPVRGRWRIQLGLTDDGPPASDRSRDRR